MVAGLAPAAVRVGAVHAVVRQHRVGVRRGFAPSNESCHVRESGRLRGHGKRRATGAGAACESQSVEGTRACVLSRLQSEFLPCNSWVTVDNGSASLFMICYDKHFFTSPPALNDLFNNFEKKFPVLRHFSPDSTIRATDIRKLFNELIKEKRSKAPDQKVVTLSLFMTLATLLIRSQREVIEQKNLTSWELSFNNSLRYLEENIQEKIGVTELAKIAGMSYRRYTEIFKEQTGITANEYIRQKRIELAQKLLQETGNIVHASIDAGFGDLSHFYRVFKQFTGITPKQFIEINSP